jgi:AcrR family transcriptional regulator
MYNETENPTQSQKILTAAFHCIATKGYANVSLRDIAHEAGVVLSQLNYYYKNKEGLFKEVIKVAIQKYLLEIENSLQKGTTIKETMSSLTKYFQNMLIETPELFRLLYDFIGMSLWSDSFGELLRQLFRDLSDLIEKHVLTNVSLNEKFVGYSPKAIARMISGAIFGITIQSILEPKKEALSDALKLIPMVFE